MPDLDGLERRLAGERAELLGRIRVPDLGMIHSRARVVRRRRRLAAAGAALALLSVVGAGIAVVRDDRAGAPQPVAASATPTFQSIWRGSGLTVYGLTAGFEDLPGSLYDIEFADARRGYALAAACPGGGENCELAFGVTTDGGRTWTRQTLPVERVAAFLPDDSLPTLVTFGTDRVGLFGDAAWIRTGGVWTPVDVASARPVGSVPKGGRLWMRTAHTCVPGPLYVWQMDGTLGTLASPPPIQTCRVTFAPGGTWWAGGYVNGASGRRPAVAVSQDAGRTWLPTTLPAASGDAWAQVSPLGTDVYASVVSPRGGQPYTEALNLHAVYRSANGGGFQAYGPTTGAVVGEVVPLLDGRIVAAGPGWHLAAAGGELEKDTGSLPFVRRFSRTPGGWIAYDLFQGGWAALSRDGLSWHKLNVR